MSDPCAFVVAILWDGSAYPEIGEPQGASANLALTLAEAETVLERRRSEPGFMCGEIVEGLDGLSAWLERMRAEAR